MTPIIIIIIMLLLLLFLTAFTLGRRYGHAEGLRVGLATAILDLRIAALKQGHCPICQQAEHDQTNKFPDSDGETPASKLGKYVQVT